MTILPDDRIQIIDLMSGWTYRDTANWDMLRTLWHPDGTIKITWYEGPFGGFVDGSVRMAGSPFNTKHLIGTPLPKFNAQGNRAIVETSAMILGENMGLGLGCAVQNRFYDTVEKRDGLWKILFRQAIYDMSTFTFPKGFVEIDQDALAKYPAEYAALAYVLEKSGFPVKGTFPTRFGDLEKAMRVEAEKWLAA
jgi:hypothetical protein